MFRKFSFFIIIFAVMVFAVSCDDSKKSAKDDIQITDNDDVSDEESDETAQDDETDIEPDEDADENETDTESDEDEISDEDIIQISGGITGTLWVENGSKENIEISLFECGSEPEIATSETDENGNYEIEYDLVNSTTYCVESNGLFSCFTAENDVHKAEINPLTHLAFLRMQVAGGCSKLMDVEKEVRNYMKLGTGNWLGELDYSDLEGVQSGFESLKGILEKDSVADTLLNVETDIAQDNDYAALFNGFDISADPDEIIIEDTTTPAEITVTGRSGVLFPGFNVKWTLLNQEEEGAETSIWSDEPGEYVVKGSLFNDSDDLIATSYKTVTFFTVQKEGVIDVSDMSADMSFWFTDNAVSVFAAGTEIKLGDNAVTEIGYKLLSGGESSSISKVVFSPSGTVFLNDPMFLIIDLNSVFSGDPIMLGVQRVEGDGTMSVLNQASGDPIMLTASGDPIMFTASGDPIMSIASGDPIMGGDMSNVLVTATTHFSDFSVKKRSVPVNVKELLESWENDYSEEENPFRFIFNAIELYKGTGAAELKKFFTGRDGIAEIEGDISKLLNREVGAVRNLNIFENLYYLDRTMSRFDLRKTSSGMERFSAVYNGFDIGNFIYQQYVDRMTHERSVTFSDIFDRTLLPVTHVLQDPSTLPDLRAAAAEGLLKKQISAVNRHYLVSKREALALLKYVNISKGPDFGVLNGLLSSETVICMWLTEKTRVQCGTDPGTYSINDSGQVLIDGTVVTEEHIDNVFRTKLNKLPADMILKTKHTLFRTLYMIITYISNIYENGPKVMAFKEALRKMVVAMVDGIDSDSSAVNIVETSSGNEITVAVVKDNSKKEVPIFSSVFDLFDNVYAVMPDVFAVGDKISVISVKIHGYGYSLNVENGSDKRPVYDIVNDMGIKTFTIKDVDDEKFTKDDSGLRTRSLSAIFESVDLDSFGDCYGEVTVSVISAVGGKKHLREKNFSINTGSISDAENAEGAVQNSVNSSAVLEVYIYDENYALMPLSNSGIIVNPGNMIFKNRITDPIVLKGLKPAVYSVEGFAEGYYSMKTAVPVNEGDFKSISLYLSKIQTGTEKGSVQLHFQKRSEGGGSTDLESSDLLDVYLVDGNTDIVKNVKGHDGSTFLEMTDISYGQYTLKVASSKFYTLVDTLLVSQPSFEHYFTLETKNICGNGIKEVGEDCDGGMETGPTNIKCKDIDPSAFFPENNVYCGYDCLFDTTVCDEPN